MMVTMTVPARLCHSHARKTAMLPDRSWPLKALDETLVLPSCTRDAPLSLPPDNGDGSQWFEPRGNATTMHPLPGCAAVMWTASSAVQPVPQPLEGHQAVASDHVCSVLLACSATSPVQQVVTQAAGTAVGGSGASARSATSGGAAGADATGSAAVGVALESDITEPMDPRKAVNCPLLSSSTSPHRILPSGCAALPVYPLGALCPVSPPACLHQQADSEPQMNTTTAETGQPGCVSLNLQADAATTEHPALTALSASVVVPLPGCELFTTSAALLDRLHDDSSLSITVGSGISNCGINMGLPCDTRNGRKFEVPVVVTPHTLSQSMNEDSSHAACSSGNGNKSDREYQPQSCLKEKVSVDLLREIDDMLSAATGTMHNCATNWEPADKPEEDKAGLYDLPDGLHESTLAIDELVAGDWVSPAVTSSCLLPGLAISTDVDVVAGLPGGVDEAEVQRLAAMLLADIETSEPEAPRSPGDDRQARSSSRQLTAAGGVEGTAHRPTAAVKDEGDDNEVEAEAYALEDMATEGSGEAPPTPSGCRVLPQLQHETGSGSEGEATPTRGTTSGRSARRVQRNRNYHTPGKYRGVRCRREGRYSAELKVGNVRRWLGTFSTAEEAAQAFDKAAVEVSGSKARLNFPLQDNTVCDQAKKRKRKEEWCSEGGGSPGKKHLSDNSKGLAVDAAGCSPTTCKENAHAHGPITPHINPTRHSRV